MQTFLSQKLYLSITITVCPKMFYQCSYRLYKYTRLQGHNCHNKGFARQWAILAIGLNQIRQNQPGQIPWISGNKKGFMLNATISCPNFLEILWLWNPAGFTGAWRFRIWRLLLVRIRMLGVSWAGLVTDPAVAAAVAVVVVASFLMILRV